MAEADYLRCMSTAASRRPTRARIDLPNAVRGASTGFSILVIGGLLATFATLISPVFGAFWLAGVAIAAFAVAAKQSQQAQNPLLHGAVAALSAYLLVLPLILPFEAGRDLSQIAMTTLTALVVGPVSAWVSARRAS